MATQTRPRASNARSRASTSKRQTPRRRTSGKAAARSNGRVSARPQRRPSVQRGRSRSRTTASRRRAPSSNGAVGTIRRSAGSAAGTVGEAGKYAVKFIAAPMASAAAGAAAGMIGGIALERYGLRRKRRKVLGVRLPGSRNGLDDLAKQVGKAGNQFGKLAGEVRTTRKKAEDIGKALS